MFAVDLSIISAAFLAGFLGSPHCLGMCGGIVSAFGMSIRQPSQTDLSRSVSVPTVQSVKLLTLMYHLGRLVSYSSLGLLIGFLGETALTPFLHTMFPRLLLGLVFVLLGALMLGFKGLNAFEVWGGKIWSRLAPLRKKLFPLNTVPRAFAAGLLWGFLPCGLVYGALLLSLTSHQAVIGALAMFAFGLGTLPMLLTSGVVAQKMSQFISAKKLRLINAVLMIAVGVWIMMPYFGKHHHVMAGMQSDMSGMDHSKMAGMEGDMSGMDHSKMAGMQDAMAGSDHDEATHK